MIADGPTRIIHCPCNYGNEVACKKHAGEPAACSRDWDDWASRHGYRRTNPGLEPAHYVPDGDRAA